MNVPSLNPPLHFRRFIRAIFHYFETSVGDVILRVLCLLGIALGVALIYVGIYVV